MNKIAIGVDVGGSHISCVACDIIEKKYLANTFSENSSENKGSADEIIKVWSRTLQVTIDKIGLNNVSGIGFAMPGPFDYANGIALFDVNVGKYEKLFGMNVPEAIRKALHLPTDFAIRFINDATAFAIGEDWIGKASGSKRSLAITLGTGFGSAFLADSLPVVAGFDVPPSGCVWHLPFEKGIADDYFSTRGFSNRYFLQTGKHLAGVNELARQASTDLVSQMLFTDFGHKLGVFLAPWMLKFGVEVLVMGGNISQAFPYFGESLQSELVSRGVGSRVEVSDLKEAASMIGSAVLIDDEYYSKVKLLLPLMS